MLRTLPFRPVADSVAAEAADDRRLVEAARSDPAAFAQLYTAYLPRIYRYLAARAASAEEAADLTQNVFLRAFEALPSYRPDRMTVAPWLFRIARNAAIDAHRRSQPAADLATTAAPVAPHPGPEAEALQAERVGELRLVLAQLEPPKRELLALRFAAGLSSREIGLVVGKSEAAVKKQLTRIIDSLKEHYRDRLD